MVYLSKVSRNLASSDELFNRGRSASDKQQASIWVISVNSYNSGSHQRSLKLKPPQDLQGEHLISHSVAPVEWQSHQVSLLQGHATCEAWGRSTWGVCEAGSYRLVLSMLCTTAVVSMLKRSV